MFSNPFSVLEQNIKKVASNSPQYPDEDAINCIFVMYSGNAEKYQQDVVVEEVLEAMQRAQGYSYVKLCYAVLELLVKSETVEQTERDVSSLPFHFLKEREVYQQSERAVSYAQVFGEFVVHALSSGQQAPTPNEQSPPRNIESLVLMFRACGALCQHDDTDELLLFLKNQSLKHGLREISALLTNCASYYTLVGNLDYLKPFLPDLRLSIRQLASACNINGISAEISDVPDLLERMSKGKFTTSDINEYQQNIVKSAQEQYGVGMSATEPLTTQPAAYVYNEEPCEEPEHPFAESNNAECSELSQENVMLTTQTPEAPLASQTANMASPGLAGSYGAIPKTEVEPLQNGFSPSYAVSAEKEEMTPEYEEELEQYEIMEPEEYQEQEEMPQYEFNSVEPLKGSSQGYVEEPIQTAPAIPHASFNAPEIEQFEQFAQPSELSQPEKPSDIDDLLGL